MGRTHRIDQPAAWHHVINRGAARRPIFFGDRDRVEFECLLGLAHDRFAMQVHAYCLMGNHFHLLVECPDGGLSDAMHLIGSVYVRRVNARRGRDGPMFRDRFFAKQVHDDAYLMRLVRYIHQNPRAIVGDAALLSYRWSSLRVYARRRAVPSWMCTDPVVALFGGTNRVVASAFETPSATMPVPDADSVMAAIAVVVNGVATEGTNRGLERTVATLLLERPGLVTGRRRDDLVEALGPRSPDAWRAARSRALRQVRSNPAIVQVVDEVLDLVA